MRKIRVSKLRNTIKKAMAFLLAISMTFSGINFSDNRTYVVAQEGIEPLADLDNEPEMLELPVEFIDYRGDNLLFEYIMKYANDHKHTDEFTFTENDVENYGGIIDRESDLHGTPFTKNLVLDTLSEDGRPVYTKQAVEYIAKAVAAELNKQRTEEENGYDFMIKLRDNILKRENPDPAVTYDFRDPSIDYTNWTIENESWFPVSAGGNLKGNGNPGAAYYDVNVTPNTKWTMIGWFFGEKFGYQVIGLDEEGNENEIIVSGDTWTISEGGWNGINREFNVGNYSKMRIKLINYATELEVPPSEIGGNLELIYFGDIYELGSYEDSKYKDDNGLFNSIADIKTCYDYAYYMLNHYFDPDTIMGNYYDDIFTKLQLNKDPKSGGYSFLANFDVNHGIDQANGYNFRKIIYDTANKVISNDMSTVDSTQKGFFPLSSDNANNAVKLETTDSQDGEENKPLYKIYIGTNWNGDTASYWMDPNDSTHFVLKHDSSNWAGLWGAQYVRYIHGLKPNTKYTVTVDINSTNTDGSIFTNGSGYDETINMTGGTQTVSVTKNTDADGTFELLFAFTYLGVSNIIQFSHVTVTEDGQSSPVIETAYYDRSVLDNAEYSLTKLDTEADHFIYDVTYGSAIGVHEFEALGNGYYLEAEDGTLSVFTDSTIEESTNFSNGQALGNMSFGLNTPKRFTRFNIQSDKEGAFRLKIFGAGGIDKESLSNVYVRTNSGEWNTYQWTAATTSWDIVSGPLTIYVNLKYGNNIIDISGLEVTGNQEEWEWLNLDYISISEDRDINFYNDSDTAGYLETAGSIDGVSVKENYHYAMISNGKFVYQRAKDLYFTFTGDDDVYLFINNKLAIDIGGAHLAVTQNVRLNDIAESLGLVDGEIYSFNFFYLERHTDFSNLRINTNIDVLNSGAKVTKQAYENEFTGTLEDKLIENAKITKLKAGDYIDYAISMYNVSDLPIKKISFVDEMLNVNLNGNTGEYTISNMSANDFFNSGNRLKVKIVWHTDSITTDSAVATISNVSQLNGILQSDQTIIREVFGANGAKVVEGALFIDNNNGQEVIGYDRNVDVILAGFKYQIKENETIINNVVSGKFYAYDTLFTGLTENEAGEAEHITVVPIDYYAQDRSDNTVLLVDLGNKLKEVDDSVIMQIEQNNRVVTRSTSSTEVGCGEVITEIDANGVDVVKYTPKGKLTNSMDDEFLYVKDTGETDEDGNKIYVAVPVVVHLFDVNRDVYVLDYGLPVHLNAQPNGILLNDEIDDSRIADKKLVVPAVSLTYGAVGGVDSTVSKDISDLMKGEYAATYVPQRFMEDVDAANYTVKIRKSGMDMTSEGLTSDKGVDLVGDIEIMPANVVYYEDNFVQVTDRNTGNSNVGNIPDRVQSNGQKGEYGRDDAYMQEDKDSANTTTTITTNAYYDASGNYVAGDSDMVTFEFRGTGFDVIGRTGINSPILMCQYTDENGNWNGMKIINTHYANGTLYNIPVISVRDLVYGTHKVKLYVAPSRTGGTNADGNVFHLDGIRIYNPNNTSEVLSNYNVGEKGADFINVQDMLTGTGEVTETIVKTDNGDIVVDAEAEGRNALIVNIPKNEMNIGKPVLLGYTNTEEILGEKPLYSNSLKDYLAKGPNNEIYLSSGNAIAFVVYGYDINATKIQVEAKVKSPIQGQDPAELKLVTKDSNGNYMEEPIATVNTDVSMYYEIPIDKCITTSKGLLVIIEAVTNQSDDWIAISNIKASNYQTFMLPSYSATSNQEETDVEVDVTNMIVSNFVFKEVKVRNAYVNKTAEVRITVETNIDFNSFEGKFDAYFDISSPESNSTTAQVYNYVSPNDETEDTKWRYIAGVVNGDGTYTYVYELYMPNSPLTMDLILSHTGDDNAYKIKRVITVKGSISE